MLLLLLPADSLQAASCIYPTKIEQLLYSTMFSFGRRLYFPAQPTGGFTAKLHKTDTRGSSNNKNYEKETTPKQVQSQPTA